ncbi:MAG: hypothetical protein K6A94_03025 [Bacteroidales bacterium]|nr:hypothetical protein [Bacteroidales bacterium]
MKTKKMILVAAMAIGAAALTAFTVMPDTDYPDEPKKTTRQDDVVSTENEEDAGSLCPCSELRCGICGGKVEWTANAYVKERRKCTNCNGKGYICNPNTGCYGCTLCDSTGVYTEWAAGCRCYNCNQGFKQPNDC